MAAPFLERLRERPLLGDGAMGTMLYARGVPLDACFDVLNVNEPKIVQGIHAEYIQAGADWIETNTFGANRFKLGVHGLSVARARDQPPRRQAGARRARDHGARRLRAGLDRPARQVPGPARIDHARGGARGIPRAGRGAARRRRGRLRRRDILGSRRAAAGRRGDSRHHRPADHRLGRLHPGPRDLPRPHAGRGRADAPRACPSRGSAPTAPSARARSTTCSSRCCPRPAACPCHPAERRSAEPRRRAPHLHLVAGVHGRVRGADDRSGRPPRRRLLRHHGRPHPRHARGGGPSRAALRRREGGRAAARPCRGEPRADAADDRGADPAPAQGRRRASSSSRSSWIRRAATTSRSSSRAPSSSRSAASRSWTSTTARSDGCACRCCPRPSWSARRPGSTSTCTSPAATGTSWASRPTCSARTPSTSATSSR